MNLNSYEGEKAVFNAIYRYLKKSGIFSRVAFISAVIFFRLILDVTYIYYVSPAFENDPITTLIIDFSINQYLISILLAVSVAAFVPFGKKNFSGIFFMSAMLFLFIPMTSMYGLDRNLSELPVVASLIGIGTAYIASRVWFKRVVIPVYKNGENAAIIISGFFVVLFLLWSIMSGAAAIINIDLSKIYLFREEISSTLDVGIVAYFNLWSQKVFNPLLLAIALYKRNRSLIVITLAIQFYFFAVTQHRIHLFVPILIYMTYLLYSYTITLSRLYFLAGTALSIFLVVAVYFELDTAASLIIRRALFVPASVTFGWYDYFLDQPKVFWSDRFLIGRSATQYTGEILPHYMGDFKAPGNPFSYSVGIVGSGYAQAGILGVIFYAGILGWILKFVNALIRRGLPTYIAAAILIGPIRTAWADSDLFSALLSQGILISLLILWLFGKPECKI